MKRKRTTAGHRRRLSETGSEASWFARLPEVKVFFFFRRLQMKLLLTLAVAGGLMSASIANAAVDADAAQALLKKSDCFKCHAMDKKKDGPAFKEVSKKYKGKADGEDKLTKHITSGPMIEMDGKKEEHKVIKTKDAAEIKNVVQYILSL
jgi:cytochrome c